MGEKRLSIGVAGGGTAGLVAALMLRKAFPRSEVTVISSSDIGIIGVGEGSTEHWRRFMTLCDINTNEMVAKASATHKYGIRFKDWSVKFPDYFHSVSGDENVYAWNLFGTYMTLISEDRLLTNETGSAGLFSGQINGENIHDSTNQFHFDTFQLNEYLTRLASRRGVKFVDATIYGAEHDDTGNVTKVHLHEGVPVEADFWIDATGFRRILSTAVGNTEWNSFSNYLLMDSAFAFPTESDPSGLINTFTWSRALSSGWAWEIPTQQRRGNGYVYCSEFISEDDAVKEISTQVIGREIEPVRSFKFDAGHLRSAWTKNVCAVGLAAAFVEPLEATSIGSTIQQMDHLIPYIASYQPHHWASQRAYNKSFNVMMDNILTMIRLHYVSDRRDTPFWRAAAEMPINDSLQELLDLWKETTIPRQYIPNNQGQMFQIAHLIHVAQGQDVINLEPIARTLRNLDLESKVESELRTLRHNRKNEYLIDHAEALRALHE